MNKMAIVIATKDRETELRRLLKSLCVDLKESLQVVIVDASVKLKPQSYTDVEFEPLSIKYVRARRACLPDQRNQGIALVDPKANLICFLDDDIVVYPGALKAMYQFWMTADFRVGGVVFNIVNEKKPTFGVYFKKLFLTGGPERGRVFRSGYNTLMCPASKNKEVDWLFGGATVWRRQVFEEFLFDPWFEGTGLCEDLDFSFRVGQKYRLMVIADACVDHLSGGVTRRKNVWFGKSQFKNRYYFVRKNGLSVPLFFWAGLGMLIENFLLGVFYLEWGYWLRLWGNFLGITEIPAISRQMSQQVLPVKPFFAKDVKVTVLMTVYNGGAYLREAVESVLQQSYGAFEFLVINDASTDDSLEVLRSFTDPRLKIITNEKNCGQTRSLNFGLREASGDYVARIDADDVALKSWLEGQVAYLQKNPECDVLSAWALKIDAEGKPSGVMELPLTKEGLVRRSLTASPINHGGCLMRRSLVLALGGYREDYRVVADYDLWSRFLRSGYTLAVRRSPGMAVRFHGASISVAKKYDVVMPETIQVMKANIEAFTDSRFTLDEIKGLWQANYDQASIGIDDYLRARQVVLKMADHLHKPWRSGDDWRSITVMDVKMGFVFISRGCGKDLRRLCQAMNVLSPWGGVAATFYVFSWFGPGMKLLPFLYEIFCKLKACLRAGILYNGHRHYIL